MQAAQKMVLRRSGARSRGMARRIYDQTEEDQDQVKPVVRRTIASDFDKLLNVPLPYRVRAWTGVVAGEVIAIGGIGYMADGTHRAAAAATVGVSVKTICRRMKASQIHAVRVTPNRRIILASEVARVLTGLCDLMVSICAYVDAGCGEAQTGPS